MTTEPETTERERAGRRAVASCDGTLGWPELKDGRTGDDRLGWPDDAEAYSETSEADDG